MMIKTYFDMNKGDCFFFFFLSDASFTGLVLVCCMQSYGYHSQWGHFASASASVAQSGIYFPLLIIQTFELL